MALFNTGRSALAPDAATAFQSEPLKSETVDLTAFRGKTIQLRFRYQLGPDDRVGSTPLGWYVDDIRITNDGWADIATVAGTSCRVTGRGTGSYCYRARTTYIVDGQTSSSNYSNVVNVTVNRSGGTVQKPDLVVSSLSASNNRAQQGEKVTL